MDVAAKPAQARFDLPMMVVERLELGVDGVRLVAHGDDRRHDEQEQPRERDRDDGPGSEAHRRPSRQSIGRVWGRHPVNTGDQKAAAGASRARGGSWPSISGIDGMDTMRRVTYD